MSSTTSLRLPAENLDGLLLRLVGYNILSGSQADDILKSREVFYSKLGTLPDNFQGFAGATVDGDYFLSGSLSGVLAAIQSASPSRPGYFSFVMPLAFVLVGWPDAPQQGKDAAFEIRGATNLMEGATVYWKVDYLKDGKVVSQDAGVASMPSNCLLVQGVAVPDGVDSALAMATILSYSGESLTPVI